MKARFFSLFIVFIVCISNNTIKAQTLKDSIFKYQELAKKNKRDIPLAILYLDKAIIIAQKQQDDSLYLNSIGRKSTLYGNGKELKSAIEQAMLLKRESIRLKDSNYIAKAYEKLGRYNEKLSNLTVAFSNYQQAAALYKKLHDTLKLARTFENISNIQNDLGDFQGAEKSAIEGLNLVKNNPKGRSPWLYNSLGVASKEQFQFEEALSWYNRGIASTKENKTTITLKQNKAVLLIKKDNYIEALQLYNSLLQESFVHNNASLKAKVIDNRAYALFKLENPAAEKEMLAALSLRKLDKDYTGLFASNIHLAEFYKQVNKKRSLNYANEALQIAQKIKSPDARLEALSAIMDLENAPNARTTAINYRNLKDSTLRAKQLQNTSYLKFKYKTEEITNENNLLHADKVQKELIIIEEKNKRYIISSLTVLLVLFALGLYFFLLERHKKERLSERLITQQNLSKKIHDELASDVYNIMSQMQQENAAISYIDSLENIYERTRDINREALITQDKMDFEDSLSQILNNYLPDHATLILNGIDEVEWENISEKIKNNIHRVLQELMTNMKKHSNASFVAISFKSENNNLKITYADNGDGTDLQAKNGSHGIKNVENRILTLNGTITFESEPAHGFQCELQVPY